MKIEESQANSCSTFSKVGMTWTYDPWSIQILFYANKAIHLEVLNSLICMNFSKPKPWTRENIHFQMREKIYVQHSSQGVYLVV